MKLSDSLRLRLVIAIALIGLLAVLAAWFASRQVVLEETAALGRLGAEESGEMARVREAVEDIAEAFHEQGGWTPTARRAVSRRLEALLGEQQTLRGYELLSDGARLVSSYEGDAPASPRLEIQIFRDAGSIADLHLHGVEPTPAEQQKFIVLQHDTVDLRAPSPRTGLLVASAVALLTLVLLVGVVLRLTQPLSAMSETVVRFGAGETTARLRVRGDDEIARLGRAFNDMADALEENETRRRNLVNDVAHELRTPLTNLRFRLESVLDGVAEATSEEVASMHADTVRLQRLVEDLQMLAVAEAGGLRLEPKPVVLRELVDGLACADRDTESVIAVQNEVPDDIVVMADPARLEQVLTNLFANAARYAPQSAVRVRALCSQRTTIEAEVLDGLQVVRPMRCPDLPDRLVVAVFVADDGPGIPADAVPFVFDRFYRVDSSRDRATGGTGLGLAVVRQLIEAQGGMVGVRSALGKGTEFVLVLPAAGRDGSA